MKTTADYDTVACEYLTEHRDAVAAKTTQRRKAAFKAFGKWARISTPMLDDYRGPTPARAVAHPLEEGIDGVKRLLTVCDDDEQRGLIALCGMAGMRIAEALTVTTDDIDLARSRVRVRGKGDKARYVPLTKSLLVALAPLMRPHDPHAPLVAMPDRTARRMITRMGKRARLKRPISSHDLRATFGTAAYYKSGKDIRAVQDLLGHADSKTTEGYTGVSEEKMHDAADLFEDDNDDEEDAA